MAIFQITIRREGNPVHEVLRPIDQPLVVRAGAELVAQLFDLDDQVSTNKSPDVGSDSVFVGQMQSGEIYNQSPSECFIQGTRRWITPGEADRVEKQFRELVAAQSERSGTRIELNYSVQGDAFRILPGHPAVKALQTAHESVTGSRLPLGPKPFLDDGNLFCSFGGIPAITHGPHATELTPSTNVVPSMSLSASPESTLSRPSPTAPMKSKLQKNELVMCSYCSPLVD